MRISVELVPRGHDQVYADALEVKAALPNVTDLNIPDLTQFELRSWHACIRTREVFQSSIPHIRAIDVAEGAEEVLGDTLLANGLREILVVRGDPPHDLSRRTYPNTSEDVIRRLKSRFPELRIYAAFDPYRRGFREEMEAVRRKIAAGADGLFTQPIFDLNLRTC